MRKRKINVRGSYECGDCGYPTETWNYLNLHHKKHACLFPIEFCIVKWPQSSLTLKTRSIYMHTHMHTIEKLNQHQKWH